MNKEHLENEKQKIIRNYGNWTAHNIYIKDGVYTIDEKTQGDEIKLNRIIRTISDICDKPFKSLRILDLACLEGMYAIECARHGAETIALDVREVNVEKTKFIKETLSLDNLEIVQDDVRNISEEKYGNFDVILCLGILYHLDLPDSFRLVRQIANMADSAIFDTQISLKPNKTHIFEECTYSGRSHIEHSRKATKEQKEKELWLSIDNNYSFWFTKNSLLNLLSAVGFTSVFEVHVPIEPDKPLNRITIAAVKGHKVTLYSAPGINESEAKKIKEKTILNILKFYLLIIKNSAKFHLSKLLPEPVKNAAKTIFRI